MKKQMLQKGLVSVLMIIGMLVLPSIGQDEEDVKNFPEYGCSISLPNTTAWQWGDPKQGPEGTLAVARTKDEMMLILDVKRCEDDISFEDLMVECEKEATKDPNVRKVSSKKTVFIDVSAYDIVCVQTDAGSKVFKRGFLKNQIKYELLLLVPKRIRINREMLERIYQSFSWHLTEEEIQAKQKAKKESYVYKEDTTPDDTVYSVLDAKTYELKKGDITVQIDISGDKLVKKDAIGPHYAHFYVKADDEFLRKATIRSGYLTNFTSTISVAIITKSLEEVIQQCKDRQSIRGDDELFVKEVKISNKQDNAQTGILLVVSNFHDNEPWDYRGWQFIQQAEYVVSIDVSCAQGMRMTKEYKTQFNNIVQSALKSIRINNKPVDTKVLARHVKKH